MGVAVLVNQSAVAIRRRLLEAFRKAAGDIHIHQKRSAITFEHVMDRGYLLRVRPSLLRWGPVRVTAIQKGWKHRLLIDTAASESGDLAYGIPYGTTHIVVQSRKPNFRSRYYRIEMVPAEGVDPLSHPHPVEHVITRVNPRVWRAEVEAIARKYGKPVDLSGL